MSPPSSHPHASGSGSGSGPRLPHGREKQVRATPRFLRFSSLGVGPKDHNFQAQMLDEIDEEWYSIDMQTLMDKYVPGAGLKPNSPILRRASKVLVEGFNLDYRSKVSETSLYLPLVRPCPKSSLPICLFIAYFRHSAMRST